MNTTKLRIPLAAVFAALLFAGCGGDDPVAPNASPQKVATKDRISVQMSSITAITDCDPTGGPGDFYVTLIVHKKFEDGNILEIGRTLQLLMQVNDGETLGAPSGVTPVEFEMPREPGAMFTVESYIRESDGGGVYSIDLHNYGQHVFDRNDYDTWGPGDRDFESYTTLDDGTTVGVYKFAVWSNAGDCRGYANYAVYITPIYE